MTSFLQSVLAILRVSFTHLKTRFLYRFTHSTLSTTTASNMTGNLHPLSVDLIIEEIIQYLDFENLKECRLINRRWNEIIYSAIEKRAEKDICLIGDPTEIPSLADLPKYTETIIITRMNRRQQCHIERREFPNLWCLTLASPVHLQEISTLISTPLLTVLVLEYSNHWITVPINLIPSTVKILSLRAIRLTCPSPTMVGPLSKPFNLALDILALENYNFDDIKKNKAFKFIIADELFCSDLEFETIAQSTPLEYCKSLRKWGVRFPSLCKELYVGPVGVGRERVYLHLKDWPGTDLDEPGYLSSFNEFVMPFGWWGTNNMVWHLKGKGFLPNYTFKCLTYSR